MPPEKIHSISNKMKKKGVALRKYDLFAIRIIVDAPPEKRRRIAGKCTDHYDSYIPSTERLRDWLSNPKKAMLRSVAYYCDGPAAAG